MTPVPTLQMQNVFVLSGTPEHTFVQPVEYTNLLVALQTAGRSIVIEGPSGIGKTSSVNKAIAESALTGHVVSLSARKKEDIAIIRELANQLPLGTVVIDDFHRLDDVIKMELADLMKTLADEGTSHSKLIVIGIPNAGKSLISFGKDLTNRIEVLPFEANPQYKVEEVLSLGERALNITINIKEEIIQAAQGSFYIAQMLAYHTCIRSKILATVLGGASTSESFESVKTSVMSSLSRSFHDTSIAFARGKKLYREGRAPYLHLLYWLSQSKNWTVNADREADRHPEQRGSVSQVVSKGFLADLINSSEDIQRVLYFDSANHTLTAQDPQFVFYIRNLSWAKLAEEVGFVSLDFPSRYDFALSFAGRDRDIADGLFHSLQEREFEIFYDKNEQHRILAEDVEEYLAPIYASDAQFVICILGKDYPKRIWTKFESKQFKQRLPLGEVIPIVLNDVELGAFDEAGKIGYIGWDRGGDFSAQINTAVELMAKKSAETRAKRRIEIEMKMEKDAIEAGKVSGEQIELNLTIPEA